MIGSARPWLLAGALGAAGLAWLLPAVWPGGHEPDRPPDAQVAPLQAPAPTLPAGSVADAPPQPDLPVYAELVRQLQRHPDDGRALVFKARLDMQARRFDLAAAGYAQAVSVAPKVARDAGIWVEYAEARGMTQGGTLAGEPEQLLQKALALDARHAQALDLAGSAAWERRDFTQAAQYWQRLLAQIPAASTRHAALAAAIERAQLRAKLTLPPKP